MPHGMETGGGEEEPEAFAPPHDLRLFAANLPTKIQDFRGFDSSIILTLRGGILMSIGNSPDILSQLILVGRFLVEGLRELWPDLKCDAHVCA